MHWFDDTEKQSKALVGFLNLGLSAYQDKKGFHDKLKFLTDIHYKRGIRAPSYGPFGEALFWTLEFCLGQEIYNEDAHRAWVILYSMILRIMVGKTVELEVKASNEREKQNADTGTEDVIKTATEAKVVPTHIRSYSYREDFNYPVYERAEVN
jgi:hemoglobin-like flavoprotein